MQLKLLSLLILSGFVITNFGQQEEADFVTLKSGMQVSKKAYEQAGMFVEEMRDDSQQCKSTGISTLLGVYNYCQNGTGNFEKVMREYGMEDPSKSCQVLREALKHETDDQGRNSIYVNNPLG